MSQGIPVNRPNRGVVVPAPPKHWRLRRFLMRLFARINPGDIVISHHFTGDRIRIHSFRHRNYWFVGRRREHQTMQLFQRLIQEGETVFDVGSNIGYIALYFAKRVGPTGRVYAFEPAPSNLPYLRKNVGHKPNIDLIENGVARTPGKLDFYVESLSGQNCSFVRDFDGFQLNAAYAGFEPRVEKISVDVVSLDDFAGGLGARPDFIKIDVEGFELEVLGGACGLLRQTPPRLMVEVHRDERNQQDLFALLSECGYAMFNPRREAVSAPAGLSGNTFCLHREAHAAALSDLELL
jgi:FkbM family methyltransferase